MRVRRHTVAAAVVGGMMVVMLAGCAPPPVRDFKFSDAELGLEGASVELVMTFTCQPGRNLNIAFGGAQVSQADDERLAQGFGSFDKAFPGVPCTGRPQGARFTVFNNGPWVFEEGSAAVIGNVFLFNPVTEELFGFDSAFQRIRIVDEAPQRAPATDGPPVMDPRYKSS